MSAWLLNRDMVLVHESGKCGVYPVLIVPRGAVRWVWSNWATGKLRRGLALTRNEAKFLAWP